MRKYQVFADGIGYRDGNARVIVGGEFFNTKMREVQELKALCLKHIALPEREAMESIFGQEYLTWADFRDIILLFTAEQARREEWGWRDTSLNDRLAAVSWATLPVRHQAPEFFKAEIQRGVQNAKGAIFMAGFPSADKYWERINGIKEEAIK